ncbi:hypothetical protein NKG94_01165 [Micromonospora sp. M12]
MNIRTNGSTARRTVVRAIANQLVTAGVPAHRLRHIGIGDAGAGRGVPHCSPD